MGILWFRVVWLAENTLILGVQDHSGSIVRLGFNLWLVSSFYIGYFGLRIKTKNPYIIIEAHIYNYASVTKIEIYASNSANSCKVVETDLEHNATPSFSLWATANRDSDGYFIFWANLYHHWFGSFFIHLLDNTGESEVTAGSADRQDSGSIKVYQQ